MVDTHVVFGASTGVTDKNHQFNEGFFFFNRNTKNKKLKYYFIVHIFL